MPAPYGKLTSDSAVPITEPAKPEQVVNSTGGFVFALDDWSRLERFLILGSESNTYYTSARKLSRENAQVLQRCITANGPRVVQLIKDISLGGRAPKNDPALFALALCSKASDELTRKIALGALPEIARTSTHLFDFLNYCKDVGRGFGHAMQGALQRWYLDRSPDSLANQLVKYRQRNGWTHRDVLRKARPTPTDELGQLLSWAAGKEIQSPHPLIEGFEKIQKETSPAHAAQLISDYKLPREAVPTELLKNPLIWDALLPHMGLTALIRNLGNMSKSGLTGPLSDAELQIVQMLGNQDSLVKQRVHPIAVLAAHETYRSGHGFRGQSSWPVNQRIVAALENAFVLAFNSITPTSKRIMLALDVSASMEGGYCTGVEMLTPRMACAAMSMVAIRTWDRVWPTCFSTQFMEFPIHKMSSLEKVVTTMEGMPFGSTQIEIPMKAARYNKVPIDAFVVYTDNEVNVGNHPYRALLDYRQAMGLPSKLIVCAMTSTGFTIADPSDGGMLDVVGFDTTVPNLIADFA